MTRAPILQSGRRRRQVESFDVESPDARRLAGVEQRRQQAVVGRHEHVVLALGDEDVPFRAHARIDDREVNGSGREVAIRAADPEACLGWPLCRYIVREIDDACLGEARKDDASL